MWSSSQLAGATPDVLQSAFDHALMMSLITSYFITPN
jgi:hypothetical protein